MAAELKESSGLREIPASEILEKIQKGEPVEYDHVIIKGNLEVSRLEVPTDEIGKKIIGSLINIRNSLINGASNFSDTIFGEIVDFNGSQFNGMAEFLCTQFNRNVSFAESQFSKEARFAGAQFCEDTTFTHAEFNRFAHFTEAQFIKNADFFQTQFDKGSDFEKTKFKGKETSFNGAEFSKFADFDKAEIVGEQIEFMGVQFRNGLSFKEARLSGDKIHFDTAGFGSFVAFNKTEFSGKEILFDGSEFRGFTDFSNAQFNGDASFFNAQFIGATTFIESRFDKHLNLNASSIKHMLFHVSLGDTSRISLRNSDLAFLEVSWELIKDRLDYDESAYLALIKNYNNQGNFYDADRCNWQYRTIRRQEHLDGLKWAFDLLPWQFYGYGVRFYYPLAWLILILIISAILYMLSGQAQFPGGFGLSAVILTTTTQIGSLTGLCWYLSIVERISGWLLMSTFLVALAKKTLR